MRLAPAADLRARLVDREFRFFDDEFAPETGQDSQGLSACLPDPVQVSADRLPCRARSTRKPGSWRRKLLDNQRPQRTGPEGFGSSQPT